MSKYVNSNNLSELEINQIELSLNDGLKPSEIGQLMDRDPSGIRKEIKNYSTYVGIRRNCKECLNKDDCNIHYLCKEVKDHKKCSRCKSCDKAANICPGFKINIDCELLKKKKVCNNCDLKSKCEITLRYIAYQAILKHKSCKNNSHSSIKLKDFPSEYIDYLSGRIKAGISPDIILNTLPDEYKEYKVSTPTLYSYIDNGLLKDCINIDLRNKVSRCDYGSSSIVRHTVSGHQLNGRSIENLSDEELKRPLGVSEMDTVEGIKGGAVLLTLMIPKYSLMLAFKMKAKNQKEVKLKLDTLEFKLGNMFYVLFNKIIPDNGVEFLDFESLEKSINKGQTRCHVHYTHAYASYEKPHVENNHILLRWLIRKGYDITLISDDKILEIINILNNYPRPEKGYKTPIELMEEELGEEIIKKLQLKKIPISELSLHISLND